MNLFLQREPSGEFCTHGNLYIGNIWVCFSLEDVVRDEKIPGETAIPAGTYRITMEDSPRFGPDTITINDVPHFSGVRIHAGNSAADTRGCPLVGQARTATGLLRSKAALGCLKDKVRTLLGHGEVWLVIEDG